MKTTVLPATHLRLQSPQMERFRKREALARAYRRALRIAEYRAWLAIEPRAASAQPDARPRNLRGKLMVLGTALTAATALLGLAIYCTPLLRWVVELPAW